MHAQVVYHCSVYIGSGLRHLIRASDRVREKNKKLCRNFQEYYAEENVDYVENLLDYETVEFVLWSTFIQIIIRLAPRAGKMN